MIYNLFFKEKTTCVLILSNCSQHMSLHLEQKVVSLLEWQS